MYGTSTCLKSKSIWDQFATNVSPASEHWNIGCRRVAHLLILEPKPEFWIPSLLEIHVLQTNLEELVYCRLIDQPEVCHLHRWPKICKRLFSKFKRQCLKSTCEFLHVRWLPVSGALNILAPERLFKFTFNWEVEKYSPSFLYVWSFQFFHWQQVQLQLVYRFQADIADHPWNKQCLQGNGKKLNFKKFWPLYDIIHTL